MMNRLQLSTKDFHEAFYLHSNKMKLQPKQKALTKPEATTEANLLLEGLINKNLSVMIRYKPDEKEIVFTGVKSADTIKHYFPQFGIKYDSRQQRFVELVIKYVN